MLGGSFSYSLSRAKRCIFLRSTICPPASHATIGKVSLPISMLIDFWLWHKAEDFPHRSDSFRFLRSFCRAYEAVGMPRARAASNKVRPRLKGPPLCP